MQARAGLKEKLPPRDVAFLLPAYNEEPTVRRAIESILAQDIKEPMDIVFSDHSSSDRTLQIMIEYEATYRGPHRIFVFKTAKEHGDTIAGLNSHINILMQRLNNKFFILGTADDEEAPSRARLMVEAWKATNAGYLTGSQHFVLPEGLEFSSMVGMTRHVHLNELVKENFFNPSMNGASCWTRKLFDRYGPLPLRWANDLVMPMWGVLSYGTYHVGKIIRTFYITGRQTGIGSQFMTEKDPIVREQKQEWMNFERCGVAMYLLDVLETELRQAELEVDVCNAETNFVYNPFLPHKTDLISAYARIMRTVITRTNEWVQQRQHMTDKGIAPLAYPR